LIFWTIFQVLTPYISGENPILHHLRSIVPALYKQDARDIDELGYHLLEEEESGSSEGEKR